MTPKNSCEHDVDWRTIDNDEDALAYLNGSGLSWAYLGLSIASYELARGKGASVTASIEFSHNSVIKACTNAIDIREAA